MIIGSKYQLKVGEVRPRMGDQYEKLRDQPFVVLRESTYEEWYNYCFELDVNPEDGAMWKPSDYFYEVSTD